MGHSRQRWEDDAGCLDSIGTADCRRVRHRDDEPMGSVEGRGSAADRVRTRRVSRAKAIGVLRPLLTSDRPRARLPDSSRTIVGPGADFYLLPGTTLSTSPTTLVRPESSSARPESLSARLESSSARPPSSSCTAAIIVRTTAIVVGTVGTVGIIVRTAVIIAGTDGYVVCARGNELSGRRNEGTERGERCWQRGRRPYGVGTDVYTAGNVVGKVSRQILRLVE